MPEDRSCDTFQAARRVSAGDEGMDSDRDSPRRNRLLAALPPGDYQRLLPALEPVPLPSGWTVYGTGSREPFLYFPTSGIVSRFYVTESGASASVTLTGNEGVIGVASFLGGESTPTQAVVLVAGTSYRLPAARLHHEFEHDGPLPQLLLRYTRALMVQTAQVAVCNRHHSLQQQLCRWILTCLDRLPADDLAMTQELMAQMLGVRREGVTHAIGVLQAAGLIHCSRGHITVLDRARLQAQACECYGVVRREYDQLEVAEATVSRHRAE
jgi:CRP-like cAMP-binding protein